MPKPTLPRSALRVLTAALLVLVALGLLSMWALPWWLQGRGMALASSALGRSLSVERASFEPWSLRLNLEGLRLAAPDAAAEAQLQIGHVELSLSLRSIWQRALVLQGLRVDSPQLRLSRLDERRLDVDDLLGLAAGESSGESPAVVLLDARLQGGQILLQDRVTAQEHRVEALSLNLPGLSLRSEDAGEPVQAQLGFKWDGVDVAVAVQGLPFAPQRQASASLKFSGLDAQPLAAYAPAGLPLRLQRGLLDAQLQLDYAESAEQAPRLKLSGQLAAREVSLAQGGQPDWLRWQALRLDIRELLPLAGRVDLAAVALDAPRLQLRRDAQGRLLLPTVGADGRQEDNKGLVWQLRIDAFKLGQGQLQWQDDALRPSSRLAVNGLDLQLDALRWPLPATAADGARLDLKGSLQGNGGKPAELQAQGRLAADSLTLQGQWRELSLAWLTPYLQSGPPLSLRGRAAGGWQLDLPQPLAAQPQQRLRVLVRDLTLDDVALQKTGAAEMASLARLQLDQARIDPAARRVALGRLRLSGPRVQMQRRADGSIDWLELFPPAPASASPAWALQLDEIALEQGRLLFSDASVQRVVRRDEEAAGQQILVDQIKAQLRALSTGVSAQGAKPAAASLSFAISRAGARRDGGVAGRVDWAGTLGLAPLAAQGQLRAERLPLNLADPYLGAKMPLHLRRGDLGFRGQIALRQQAQGLGLRAQGAMLLSDLRLFHARLKDGRREAADELLSWQSLDLAGMDLQMPANAAPVLALERASLNEFYARLIVDEAGHFNLGELRAREETPQPAAAPAPAQPGSAPLRLSVGETRLARGTVDFSDRYIRPNYSAHLSELAGSLGRFASGESAMAPLLLTGRIEGTGALQISGQLNPSGDPLAMDISASASDVELAPLSPYAGKYAGYAIERGKLSSRVHYRIDPGGQLQADNQIILNQLTFGERIDSPSATKLPVLLAVALLKDRNGVIDVNLPISGSLKDPEFSVGGLIVRVIFNLLGKALTAPFSLLAGGGSADLSQAEFLPGSAHVEAAAQQRVEQLAKSLLDRPALSLSLTGWAQLDGERAALQAHALEKDLLAERRRELRRQQNAQAQAEADGLREGAVLAPALRERMLRQLYQASKLPGRPRNMLGLLKDIAPAEMESFLLAGYPIDEAAARELALARAVALRDALIAQGVPNERLFLASPKLAEGAQPWTPRVDLSLATH